MKYTKEEKEKIYENLDTIKAYIETSIQPYLTSRVTVDFGQVTDYLDGTREKEFHLSVYPHNICCRVGGLGFDFTRDSTRTFTSATPYNRLDYAVGLFNEWNLIKAELYKAVRNEKLTRNLINNFEI